MSKSYEVIVRERMLKKYPEHLMGGTFRDKSYSHIFKELKDNFIDGEYPIEKCIKGNLTEEKIKYHYAEHLNSSQTMCIAYFKKFFESEEYEYLLIKILTMFGIDVSGADKFSNAVFEYIPYAKEGTNFDFYLKLDNGKQITWEIKFTEKAFGGTTKGAESDKYIRKYKEVYIPMLRKCAYYDFPDVDCDDYQCLKTGALTDNCCVSDKCSINEFYKYYQIRRNILYAEKEGDYVLFLTPRENKELSEGRAYIDSYANKWGTDCIRNIYWEDLLETTVSVVASVPELYGYYMKFKEKYFK